MQGNNTERRQHIRLDTCVPISLRALAFPPQAQPKLEIVSMDVSAGGLRVRTDEVLSLGQKVSVTVHMDCLSQFHPAIYKMFEPDKGQSLTAIAEVIRLDIDDNDEMSAGIQFLDVDEGDRIALMRLIQSTLERRERFPKGL